MIDRIFKIAVRHYYTFLITEPLQIRVNLNGEPIYQLLCVLIKQLQGKIQFLINKSKIYPII